MAIENAEYILKSGINYSRRKNISQKPKTHIMYLSPKET